MHIILAKAMADVDAAYFERFAVVDAEVLALPTVDQSIAIKGSASHVLDNETDCQNTFFLTYEAEPPVHDHFAFDGNTCEAFEPGCLYKYCGKLPQYQKTDFVELKYEHQLGQIKLIAYFLVPVTDCEFAVNDEHEGILPYTLPELWKDGYIRRTNNG